MFPRRILIRPASTQKRVLLSKLHQPQNYCMELAGHRF